MNVPRLRALSSRLHTYTGFFTLWYWSRCACGVACHMPEFNMLGLHTNAVGEPIFEGIYNWPAIMLFFGLSAAQTEHLFSRASYDGQDTTAEVVAQRIDALIASAFPQQETIERVTELA